MNDRVNIVWPREAEPTLPEGFHRTTIPSWELWYRSEAGESPVVAARTLPTLRMRVWFWVEEWRYVISRCLRRLIFGQGRIEYLRSDGTTFIRVL